MSQVRTTQAIARITREIGKDELLDLIATGTTTKQLAEIVSDRLGKTFSQYYIVKTLQSFGSDYDAAKKAQALMHADRLGEISNQVEKGDLDPASARVSSDNRKWLASRLDPKQYGDKIQADIAVTDVTALHLEALRQVMTKARAIDAEVEEIPESGIPEPDVESKDGE